MPIEQTTDCGALSEEDAAAALTRTSLAIILTNPLLPDNPIVYVNEGFERVTGYGRGDTIGRNCRFLQGPGTEQGAVAELRRAIEGEREANVDILNYRADGVPFINRLLVTPVKDGKGATTYFLGIQQVLPDSGEARGGLDDGGDVRELQHRVKNHLAMLTSFIRMQARESGASQAFSNLARRVESLQLLYDQLSYPSAGQPAGTVRLDEYLWRVAHSVSGIDGRDHIAVSVDVAEVSVPTTTAVQIGLLTSEIMTNAMQHAFEGRDGGQLDLSVEALGARGLRLGIADDGVGLPADRDWPRGESLGGRIVEGLIDGLAAELHVAGNDTGGTTVTLDIPEARKT